MPTATKTETLHGWRLTLLVCALSFSTYFCMYAFRKPFAAGTYAGAPLYGFSPKTLFVVSQIAGYALSKFVGVRLISQLARTSRLRYIIGLIAASEVSLLGFALLPISFKALALFGNGLCLGMIWSLVVRYLEGRRASEVMLAALSCSFIVASGVVKDVGRQFMQWGVSEQWMPVVTGLAFFPGLVVSARLLDAVPEPTARDERERQPRRPMTPAQQLAYVQNNWAGLSLLLLVYLALTTYRDYRDNYGVELFSELGYGGGAGLFSSTEGTVALGVLVLMATLVRFRDRLQGLVAVFALVASGLAAIGLSTLGLQGAWLSGQGWMIGAGLGAYLAYVPFSSFLFDRLTAATPSIGTAVFAVNLADAVGYSGSMAVQLYKDANAPRTSHLEFITQFGYLLSSLGCAMVVTAGVYFFKKATLRASST